MINKGLHGVEFIAVNTDAQALAYSQADKLVHIGNQVTRGLGAGGAPEMGRRAAEESAAVLQSTIGSADMVFVTAGMGGGTGTGSAPIIAHVAPGGKRRRRRGRFERPGRYPDRHPE
jgi:cell division protein FtsZ